LGDLLQKSKALVYPKKTRPTHALEGANGDSAPRSSKMVRYLALTMLQLWASPCISKIIWTTDLEDR